MTTILVFQRELGLLHYVDGTTTVKVRAKSGPWGKGMLPVGLYRVHHPIAIDALPDSPYSDDEGFAWFARLSPLFQTDRTGFGIHPDGNVPGTKGCIGITMESTRPFYDWLLRAKLPNIFLMVV